MHVSLCNCLHVSTPPSFSTDLTDYVGGPFVVDFPANETTATVHIPIVNDDETCECVEDFRAILEVPTAAGLLGVVPGVNDTATVNIIDDESKLILLTPLYYAYIL